MSWKAVIAGVGGVLLTLTTGAVAAGPFDRLENVVTEQTGTDTIPISGATFNVPGPGVGTLGVIGVIGLAGRQRRRRVDA